MLDARGGKLMCLLSLMISLPVLAQQELLRILLLRSWTKKGFQQAGANMAGAFRKANYQ